MAIPDYETVMLPLLRLSTGGPASVSAATVALAGEFKLSAEEQSQSAPDGQRSVFRADASDDHGADKGTMITTSDCSPDAIACAKRNQRKTIILVDGEALADPMIRFNVGVRLQRAVEMKRV